MTQYQLHVDQLARMCQNPDHASIYVDPMNQCFLDYDITTPLRVAHFLAQIMHETAGLSRLEESFYYSADRLKQIFPGHFIVPGMAEAYAFERERIANLVYANRLGNGPESSGDGWRYRGRGMLHLTGRQNYEDYQEFVRSPGIETQSIVETPDAVAYDEYLAASTAGWYWYSRRLNLRADKDDIRTITRRINGGLTGFAQRREQLKKVKTILELES